MKKFLRSNTFLIIISITFAILLWVYVAYAVNPIYERWINNVPVNVINSSDLFNEGTLNIKDDKIGIIKNGYTIDVKVKGKRSVISSLEADDIKCQVDFADFDKAGVYTLEPKVTIDTKKSIEVIKVDADIESVVVEHIEQSEFNIELRKKGSLPKGYTLENVSYTPTVKVTGSDTWLKDVSKAYVELDCSSLKPDDSEKRLEIVLLKRDGTKVEANEYVGITQKKITLKFNLYTKKEVTVLLRPQYKDNEKLNSEGKIVNLSVVDESKKSKFNGGIEVTVTLEGTAKALEKYTKDIVEVYTEEIDVSDITSDGVLENTYKAAPLHDVKYTSVPEVKIKAAISEENDVESSLASSFGEFNSIGDGLFDE